MSRLVYYLLVAAILAAKGVAMLCGVWCAWKAVTSGLMPGRPLPYVGWGISALLCLVVVKSQWKVNVN